mgnify:CR=1 FL=1
MSNLGTGRVLHEEARRDVAAVACELVRSGLVVNTSGNVSLRIGDTIAITPSARAYETLQPADICLVDLTGAAVDGRWLPSSELALHLALYHANPDCQAIVHTHSVNATAVSMLVDTLPAIHYQMADLGGAVPVAPYATFGSPELAASVIQAIPNHTAALMQNHGSISYGPNLQKALARTVLLEWCAEVWLKASTLGKPRVLTEEQLDATRDQMSAYGRARAACTCGDSH